MNETAFQDAVGTTKSRWDWLEEKVILNGAFTNGTGYPGIPALDLVRSHDDEMKPKSRPEHDVFGLAMLGGGMVSGAAHPFGNRPPRFVSKMRN